MSTDRQDQEDCMSFFSDIGLRADSIPEKPGVSKTPDLLVENDQFPYLVEIKTRRDSDRWISDLSEKGCAESKSPHGSIPWTYSVTEKAMKQLRAYDPDHTHLWVLWLSVRRTASREVSLEQLADSLFGVQYFYYIFNGKCFMKKCLLAQSSLFDKNSELDFVIINQNQSILPYFNDHSNRIGEFESSTLYKAFARQEKINSISALTNAGFWLYDGERDVSQEQMACYLQEKYKTGKIIPADMTTYSVVVDPTLLAKLTNATKADARGKGGTDPPALPPHRHPRA